MIKYITLKRGNKTQNSSLSNSFRGYCCDCALEVVHTWRVELLYKGVYLITSSSAPYSVTSPQQLEIHQGDSVYNTEVVNAVNEGFVYGLADYTDVRSDANNATSNSVKSVAGAL